MFHLVKYRYVFLIISLIVIIPGTVSLIFKGLNLGIDFAQGANVELRPHTQVTVSQVQRQLASLHLQDLQVTLGDNKTLSAPGTVWIRLNTQVDSNVEQYVINTLQQKYKGVVVNPFEVPVDGKTVTVFTVTKFPSTPQVSDIKALLTNLPKTSDPTKPSLTITSATPTPAATAGKGTPTPNKVAVTPTATASSTNPANIPVSVDDVTQGTTTQTINILTRTVVKTSDLPRLMGALLSNGGPYTQVISNSEVSGSVAAETTRNAFLAVLAASVAILLYIWFAFRKVPRPWRYGTCAIIALLHDVLVVLGVFSILGWAFGVQVDALFITALLTIVGFSVHDTIVVFDRIRENMQRRTVESFDQVVDASLIQTMTRSLNTSLTVLLTLSALTLFGGQSTRVFTGTLLLGIFSGTYSSIFNASMLLVMWEKHEWVFGLFNRDRGQPLTRRETRQREREVARARG